MLVTVIDCVAPVSLPITVNCVALPPAGVDGVRGTNVNLTELATTVLLLGASSSPKKKGVEAFGEPAPAPLAMS